MLADSRTYESSLGVPAGGVRLRECSVIIIGSTCKICGRDFKCESDVALHARWRHNLGSGYHLEIHKCDICDEQFSTISELRAHKRQRHKKQMQDRKRARKLRLVFKIAGVTMTVVRLNRKYLKMHSNGYLIDTGTQTDTHESEERQDDYAANIDLSLATLAVVGESRIQCIRPHEATTNRYSVHKFESTQYDAVASSTGAPARSLVEISNTASRDAITGTSEEHENPCDFAVSQQDSLTARYVLTASLANSIDIHDKENSRKLNERDDRNANSSAENALLLKDKSPCFPSEISTSELKPSPGCQRGRLGRMTSIFKQSSWSSEDPIKQSNRFNGPTASLKGPIEIIIDNETNDNDGTTTKLPIAFSEAGFNRESKSARADSGTDDDVQEVLRITRGKAQDDINHESPNRTEREMLIHNAIREIYGPSTLVGLAWPGKPNAALVTSNNNIDSLGCPPFMAIADTSCQFPTNVAGVLLPETFDEKLGIYLDNLHHYGIRYCSDLLEINNNFEEHPINTHEGFVDSWMQGARPQYSSELKANDNEAAVVID